MRKFLILDKVLLIDPSRELSDFLRFCVDRFWPGLQIVSYQSARGCPEEKFDCTEFDLVVMEHGPHIPPEQGIAWLETIRRHPAAPAVVVISSELTESVGAKAECLGAAAVLKKNDLSPNRFADCLDQVFGGLAPDLGSAAFA